MIVQYHQRYEPLIIVKQKIAALEDIIFTLSWDESVQF